MQASALRSASQPLLAVSRTRSVSPVLLDDVSHSPEAQQRRLDKEDRLIALALLFCFVVQALVLWL